MSTADEMIKLAALRQSGVLTEGEFDAEKAKLLAGIAPSAASNPSQPSGADSPQGEGWWQASNGTWYAPELREDDRSPVALSSTQVDASTPPPLTIQSEQTSSAPPPVAAGTEKWRSSHSLRVIGIVVVVLIVAVGAFFILKGSTPRSRSSQSTAAQENLLTAITGADTFYTSADATYDGIIGGTAVSSITQIDTGLSYVGASTASTRSNTISLRQSGGDVLVMTAYAPGSGICFGVLNVASALDAPFFSDYPQTAAVNTYYFSSRQSMAGSCKATLTDAQHLSSNGWPGPVTSQEKFGYQTQKIDDQADESLASLYPTTTTTAPQPGVGGGWTMTLGSENVGVTLDNVYNPAQGSDTFDQPNAGNYFVALDFTVQNNSSTPFTDDMNSDVTLVGSDNQTYTADFDTVSECTNFNNGDVALGKNASVTGCVVFQLPDTVKPAQMDFLFGDAYGSAPGVWSLG